jgi:MFS family permease
LVSGFGLVAPIFANFIEERGVGGVEVVGIAAAIFLFTKSLGQIPAAKLVDHIEGDRDDFLAMFIGSVLYSIIPIMYIFIKEPYQLYIVQFIYGVFAAFVFPAWMAIFTRHIASGTEGMAWGTYQTLVDLGTAIAAFIGGLICKWYQWTALFIVISIVTFIGSMLLLSAYRDIIWEETQSSGEEQPIEKP